MSISSERIALIEAKKHELSEAMSAGNLAPDDFVRLSKDYAAIEPVAAAAREVRRLRAERESLATMTRDADEELRAIAQDELLEIEEKLPLAERALAVQLLPKDSADERAAMLEVRAGTGGDEAALFAGDLLRMYQRFSEERGWRFELISASSADVGGYKEAVASITGNGVFARLKFESGVHRVQRVPATESGGRIHTSAATVAVLPEAEEVGVVDQRRRPAHRRLSLVGAWRPVGQHHRQRSANHPFADRTGRHPAGRKVAAQEQGQGAQGAADTTL
jgi:peptide chain release factor 1